MSAIGGGQTITWVNADQHQMPLFVREGRGYPGMISTNVQNAGRFCVRPAIPTLPQADASLQFLV